MAIRNVVTAPRPEWPTNIKVKVGDQEKTIPVTYVEKEVLAVGSYVHPKNGKSFKFGLEDLERYSDTVNAMVAAGIEIPTPVDHNNHEAKPRNEFFVSAADNLGFVVQSRVEDDKLVLVQAVVGEDAVHTALRNKCSVYIKPFKDSKGRDWGDAIVHSAYTPKPVVSGLRPFSAAGLSREPEEAVLELSREEETSMKLTPEQRTAMIQFMVMLAIKDFKKDEAEKLDDEKLMKLYVDSTSAVKELPKPEPAKPDLTKVTVEDLPAESPAAKHILALSREEEAPTPRELKAMRISAESQIDNLVTKGIATVAQGELMKSSIKADTSLLLSAEDADAQAPYEFAMKVLEAGTDRKPKKDVKLGRETPDGEEENPTKSADDAADKYSKSQKYAIPGQK
jgi:hypothetical protein